MVISSRSIQKGVLSEKLHCNKACQADTCRKGKTEKKTMQLISSQYNACGKMYAEGAHKMTHFY